MSNFNLLDVDGYEINVDGHRVINTANKGKVVIDTEVRQPAYFEYPCPLRQGRCNVRLAGGPADDGNRSKWHWNGNLDQPTLTPSVNCQSHNPENPSERYAGCGWHGFITDGIVK